MNKIWTIIIIISLGLLAFTSPDKVLPALLTGSNKALSLSFELLGIYALWLGIIGIIENTKLSKFISKLLSPIIDKFWGKNLSKEAKNSLSLSISTSLLGISGAAVPLGIKAIEEMDDKSGKATFPMIMTIVVAVGGLQLLPTTVMSLMTRLGSTSPEFIIIPNILAGLSTTIIGITLTLFIEKIKRKREKNL